MSLQLLGKGFTRVGELEVEIPALSLPILGDLQKNHSSITEIVRDFSSVRGGTVVFGRVIDVWEEISPDERERRTGWLRRADIALGYSQAFWMYERQEELFLSTLFKFGISFIRFPGLKAVDQHGFEAIPQLRQSNNRFDLSWSSLERNCVTGYPQNVIAVLK